MQIVIRHGHRALDVARAVREAVTTALADTEPTARVTVTVTNTV